MKLYHVSLTRTEAVKTFVPRVPETLSEELGEDRNIPRICLSSSIEGCLQAIEASCRIGMPMMVYTVDVDAADPALIIPEIVRKKVPDALENQEYWYTEPLQMCGQVYIVKKCDIEPCIAWSALNAEDVRRIVKDAGGSGAGDCAESVYQGFLQELKGKPILDSEKYAKEDEVYDRILELPWAHGKRVQIETELCEWDAGVTVIRLNGRLEYYKFDTMNDAEAFVEKHNRSHLTVWDNCTFDCMKIEGGAVKSSVF